MVTRRGVIDPLRLCHLRCDFCYYLHSDMVSVRPFVDVQRDVDAAVKRGDTHLDITGGEPLRYPQIADLIAYALSVGLRSRIISSLIAPQRTISAVMDAGLDDWLVSMHGAAANTHDTIVHIAGARSIQEQRLEMIRAHMGISVNYVMIRDNQSEIAQFADYVLRWRPRIVNFINFNPHYLWPKHPETGNLVADLRIAGPELDWAIDRLEGEGVAVHVRYFPMCWLREDHRENVCNDLHVALDSGEWSNALATKNLAEAERYGRGLSQRNEEQGEPCCGCALHAVCGGANKHWHAASRARDGELLRAIRPGEVGEISQPTYWHYRRNSDSRAHVERG